MRFLQVFLTVSLVSLMIVSGARAQEQVQVSNVGIRYEFGVQVTITAHLEAAAPLQSITLFIQPESKPDTLAFSVAPESDGLLEYRYAVQPGVLRPFERIYFWFGFTVDGQVQTSDRFSFRYDDNRFDWQVLQDDLARVHWYQGDAAFGQQAFDAAHAGLAAARKLVNTSPAAPVEIFVYATPSDLQSALNRNDQSWVVGHAAVDFGVVLVSVAPGPRQSLEMEQQFPHELTHILLYQKTGTGYENLPVWLREGAASVAELYPDPDYPRTLSTASENNSLIPLKDLCGSFPLDTERAYLAYAESASFVRFLFDARGNPGLDSLILAYANGVGCEQGTTAAFEKPLTELEYDWREQVLGENRAGVALRNLLPYIIVALVVLLVPLWQLSTQRKEGSEFDEHFIN